MHRPNQETERPAGAAEPSTRSSAWRRRSPRAGARWPAVAGHRRGRRGLGCLRLQALPTRSGSIRPPAGRGTSPAGNRAARCPVGPVHGGRDGSAVVGLRRSPGSRQGGPADRSPGQAVGLVSRGHPLFRAEEVGSSDEVDAAIVALDLGGSGRRRPGSSARQCARPAKGSPMHPGVGNRRSGP
jgi:hypothetical protein